MLRTVIPNAHRQHGFAVRLEWGGEGLGTLGADCGVLVIVDVLSFCTTVDIATSRGARILPLPDGDDRAAASAREAGAVLPGDGEWSLRPASVRQIPASTLLALPSPNGAALCAAATATGCVVLTAALRNAAAVGRKAATVAAGRPVGVLAAGERWTVAGRPLRPCVADHLAAGAVVAALADGVEPRSVSPEARHAERAFRSCPEDELTELVGGCVSAVELLASGQDDDVRLATMLNVSTAVPLLVDGVLRDVTAVPAPRTAAEQPA